MLRILMRPPEPSLAAFSPPALWGREGVVLSKPSAACQGVEPPSLRFLHPDA